MADIKKGANEPFLYDDQTDRITGLKNSDSTEKKFVYTDGSSGPVVITDTTASTSTTTGALRVAGGVGIGGAVNIGGAAQFNSTVAATGAATFTGGATVRPNAAANTSNVVLGGSAGNALGSANTYNVLIGGSAGSLLSGSAAANCGLGQGALQNAGSGTHSATGVGTNTLAFNTAPSNCVAIGNNAGLYDASGANNASGTNCTFVGQDARPAASGNSNSIVIGYAARGDGSNTQVFGNTSVTQTRISGTATSRFFIDGDTMRITGTRTPASNAAGTAGDFTFGTTGGVTYLYYCIASGNWGRVALTTGY